MTDYRVLTPAEMPTAVKLWVSVFEVEAEFFRSLLDGGESDDFSVGAFEEGKLISSVHVFGRNFRDREGRPRKVGGIGSVSTLPTARKKGHSGKLLQMAIDGMEERGCVWSYLGTGVHDHYAKYGWRTFSTPFLYGKLKPANSSPVLAPASLNEALLKQMAMVYAEHSQDLPMTNERTERFWDTAARYRMTRDGDEVHIDFQGDTLQGYLVAKRSDDEVELMEAIGTQDSVRSLILSYLERAASQGVVQATSSLPEASAGAQAFRDGCSEVWGGESRSWMARPIANSISWPELVAILADPRGRRSDLDNF